jgi:hypothetical protein
MALVSSDSIAIIPLTNYGLITIVDAADAPRVTKYSWHARRARDKDGEKFYAVAMVTSGGISRATRLQRFLLNAPKGKWVDHKNGLTLDNRRQNLRLCDPWQNAHNSTLQKNNTSGFRGVSWNKQAKKWQATIRCNGKSRYLGRFDDPSIAAMVYDREARLHCGEFASLNFPDAYLK